MQTKNKLMLAAAISALILLVASSAVQCALVRAAGNEQAEQEQAQSLEGSQEEAAAAADKPAPENQEAQGQPEDPPEPEGQEVSDSKKAAMFALDALRSHAWQAAGDAQTTIAFKESTFVETNAEGAKVTAFEIVGTTEGDDQGSIHVKLVRDGLGEELDSVIFMEGREGELSIASDGFRNAQSYVQAGVGAEPVATTGVTEPYTTLVDGKTDELAGAIAAYCRDHVPTATEASFDGEVFLDVKGGRVVATFHCDDKAATILSVTYAGGSFEIAG